MAFIGGDTERMRTLAESLRTKRADLDLLSQHLASQVQNEAIWQGPDADAFRNRFRSSVQPSFDALSSYIEGRGSNLDRQADDQDSTSEVGTSGGSAGAPPAKPQPEEENDPFALVKAWKSFQSVWDRGKKLWDMRHAVMEHFRSLTAADDFAALGHELAGNYLAADAHWDTKNPFSAITRKLAGMVGLPSGFLNAKGFRWVDDIAESVMKGMDTAKKLPILRVAGKALPWLDVVSGGVSIAQGLHSGDTHKVVTGGMTAAGGGLVLAGMAASATGVGATFGVPLMVAGTALSLGGAVANVAKDYFGWAGFGG